MFNSWQTYAAAAVLFASLALIIAGCWDSSDNETPSSQVSHVDVNEVTPASEAPPSNVAEYTGDDDPSNQEAYSSERALTRAADPSNQETRSTGADAHGVYNPYREAPAPLRLKIFDSYAIVRATLISSAAESEQYSAEFGGPGEFPWGRWIASARDKDSRSPGFPSDSLPVDGEYRAMHTFRFRVIEYLKGSGASEITVRARTNGTRGTEAKALQVARDTLAERDTSRDIHEAILFLGERYRDGTAEAVAESSPPEDVFQFLLSGPYGPLQYTIDTLNRVWLHAKDPPAAEGESSDEDDSALLFLTGDPSESTPSTISLGELRTEIAAVNTLIGTEGGTEEHKKCVVEGWQAEHLFSGVTANGPFVPFKTTHRLASGTSEGTVVLSYRDDGSGYDKVLVEGVEKDLFKSLLNDDDERPDNGYTIGSATARPLPAGNYQYKSILQKHYEIPCNFIRGYHTIENVVITAPDGVLHELFFDPVTVGSAVAADSTKGVLKPATFTDANGGSATINSISYESSTVKIGVSPDDALAGHVVDIIELDGTVSLSLDVADATVDSAYDTLSWTVSEQPWDDGDQLMVRIRR